MRTDDNNNPTAFTTAVAAEAGLVLGKDYEQGESFTAPAGLGDIMQTLYTAKLLGDPITITIRVIDQIGFYTGWFGLRWQYIGIPELVWVTLTPDQKRDVIGYMYEREGGITMRKLFPNYGKV